MAYTFKHGDRPVDGYTIQRAVGKGGFGEVYYAVSDGGREVALKYLHDNPQVELRGVSHCINLKSPHLVSIFDVKKTTDGEYAIIMEYCSGPSLRDLLIAEPNGFGPQKAAFFVKEIAKGLAYLHDRGIVHRDLKPGNLFYDDGYVKIGDYGLSKFISISRHSAQTASVGTVHYMAPEIGSGNYSRGVDIYALGVILYEMLLGKVPFEGSTMAEVLMKHLTTQPELDELPQPFGNVIRKALEKDPKDRYQTVDEMIGELLEVEEIRKSVAGFRPQSLDNAVNRGAGQGFDSPMPSPNPAPGFTPDAAAARHAAPPFAYPVRPNAPLPDRVAKRMDRVSRRLQSKMARLAGRAAKSAPQNAMEAARQAQDAAHKAASPTPTHPSVPFAPANRKRRIALSGLLSLGLAIGLGVLIGNTYNGRGAEALGIASSMLVLTMSGGIVVSRRASRWFGAEYGPRWSQGLITLCCCAPLMGMAVPLLLEVGGRTHLDHRGMAIWLGLLSLAVLGRWDKDMDRSANGELSFGYALWTAFVALLFTAMASVVIDSDPDDVVLVAAGIAGAVSLIVQGTGWWLPSRRLQPAQTFAQAEACGSGADVAAGMESPRPPNVPDAGAVWDARRRTVHSGAASGQGAATPLLRWGVTRAFWSLVAFALMGGVIVTFIYALVAEKTRYDDLTAVIVACTGCASFMIFFTLRKIGPVKRLGFWRETLRPFLISAAMFAIGGTITGIARLWDYRRGLDDEAKVALISGLVFASLLFVALSLFTGRKPRQPRPFLQPEGDDRSPHDGVRAPKKSSEAEDA